MQTQDRVGQRFGNYRLTECIGTGGHADVYLAANVEIPNLQYAIKILTNISLADYQKKEFLEEARIVINLRRLNPHIVNIVDVGVQEDKSGKEKNGLPYFVMEYATQGSLRKHYVRGTRVPLERIALYSKQVAEALQCAHDQRPPVMHLDVKPENMLLWSDDMILLSDFGIAIIAESGPLIKPKDTIFGTAIYMSPERISGLSGRASDQYSLGIVVYEWLCGHPPFDGKDTLEICGKHISTPPPPLHSRYAYITQGIEDVVMRALKKNPGERYGMVKEFALALEEAIQMAMRQEASVQPMRGEDGIEVTLDIRQAVQTSSRQKGPLVVPSDQSQGSSRLIHSAGLQQGGVLPVSQPRQVQAAPQKMFQPPLPPPPIPIEYITQAAAQTPRHKVREFFDFASEFATDRRNRTFRSLGTLLNVIAVLIAAFLLSHMHPFFEVLVFAVLCLFYLLLMFAFCVRAVQTVLAIFFGVLVALYWGMFGAIIGAYVASRLNLDTLLLSLVFVLIFFASSLGWHIWYVVRKYK